MSRDEFLQALKEKGIDTSIVSFDDGFKDGYCVRKVYYRWEVFMRERGQEYEVIGFPSESNALEYLFKKIVPFYEKINNKN